VIYVLLEQLIDNKFLFFSFSVYCLANSCVLKMHGRPSLHWFWVFVVSLYCH